jgi:hypothetical protein
MNQPKQERLTAFLDKTITTWPRMISPYWASDLNQLWNSWDLQPWLEPRPTEDELARAFLKQAEFRALQLGAWLTTPDGQLIAQAVEAMSPPLYRSDVELLVTALQMAAQMQQSEGQKRAGRALVGSLCGMAVILLARK